MLVQDSDVVLESYAPGLLPASMASLRPDGKPAPCVAALTGQSARSVSQGVPRMQPCGSNRGVASRDQSDDEAKSESHYHGRYRKLRERKLSTNLGSSERARGWRDTASDTDESATGGEDYADSTRN